MKKITLFFIALISYFGIFAQVGSTCSEPNVISSLPYNTSANTDVTGNNYDAPCGSYYTENDYIFEYTPASNQYVNITLTNTDNMVGLFVIDGCPDVGTCVANNDALLGNPELSLVSLVAGTTYYIMVSSDNYLGLGSETTPFTINIDTVPAIDMALTEVTGLESGCNLTQDTLVVTVVNEGAQTINSYDISYSVNGGSVVTESISDTLANGESNTIALTTYIDLSSVNHYNIDVSVVVAGDGDNTNDNIITSVVCTPQLNTFPYLQEFDGANDMWWFAEGTASTWEMGVPDATIINSASSSPNSWVTNLTGNSNRNEVSYLVTPCYDFTSLTNPKITFDLWAEMNGGIASIAMEYSTDNGINWVSVPEGIATNWDQLTMGASTGAWVTLSNTVADFAGTPNIKFRFSFLGALVSDAEGVAVDNFLIEDCVSANTPIANFTFVENGTIVDFTNNSTNANSYLWNFGDLLNSTSTETNPSFDYLIDGTYIATLTVYGECEYVTYTDTIIINTTNVNTINKTEFSVFPNPTNNYVNINTKTEGNLEIVNVNGKVLLNTNISKNKTIDVSEFDKGIYFIKYTSKNNIVNQKLIIK